METSKILTADMLDILFDGRNKAYGAYHLRRTYPQRIKKALLIVALLLLLAIAGAMAGRPAKKDHLTSEKPGITIRPVIPDDNVVRPDDRPLPKKAPVPSATLSPPAMEKFVTVAVVPDNEVVEPAPAASDLTTARTGLLSHAGDPDPYQVMPNMPGKENGIIEAKKPGADDGIWEGPVEIQASFPGGEQAWANFLRRNLNANIPPDNGAPAGVYTVYVQFVVDKEGNVSDIKALTSHGYGMEQEALRVLKKATKWKPAIQNGYPVKAYRKQPITFQVEEM